jgi:hypothetical protein
MRDDSAVPIQILSRTGSCEFSWSFDRDLDSV